MGKIDSVRTRDRLRRVNAGVRGWFAAVADCCDPNVLLCDCAAGDVCADCA